MSFYIHVALSVLLIIAAVIIYKFFLPSIYFEGFLSLLIMVPGYLFYTITVILAGYFSANRLLKVNLFGSILCCGSILLFDFLLIPFLSYNGAAIANLIAYTITTMYVITRSKEKFRISFRELLNFKKSDFDIFSDQVIKNI